MAGRPIEARLGHLTARRFVGSIDRESGPRPPECTASDSAHKFTPPRRNMEL
jgi:hypothetical protein